MLARLSYLGPPYLLKISFLITRHPDLGMTPDQAIDIVSYIAHTPSNPNVALYYTIRGQCSVVESGENVKSRQRWRR